MPLYYIVCTTCYDVITFDVALFLCTMDHTTQWVLSSIHVDVEKNPFIQNVNKPMYNLEKLPSCRLMNNDTFFHKIFWSVLFGSNSEFAICHVVRHGNVSERRIQKGPVVGLVTGGIVEFTLPWCAMWQIANSLLSKILPEKITTQHCHMCNMILKASNFSDGPRHWVKPKKSLSHVSRSTLMRPECPDVVKVQYHVKIVAAHFTLLLNKIIYPKCQQAHYNLENCLLPLNLNTFFHKKFWSILNGNTFKILPEKIATWQWHHPT